MQIVVLVLEPPAIIAFSILGFGTNVSYFTTCTDSLVLAVINRTPFPTHFYTFQH